MWHNQERTLKEKNLLHHLFKNLLNHSPRKKGSFGMLGKKVGIKKIISSLKKALIKHSMKPRKRPNRRLPAIRKMLLELQSKSVRTAKA